MRILLDQGVYDLRNKGNVALLQMAAHRLRRRWPESILEVITSAPHLLRLYCPEAVPVSPNNPSDGERDWTAIDAIVARLPRCVLRAALELREEVRLRRSADPVAPSGPAEPSGTAEGVGMASLGAVRGVDLFVATGAQYMSDACPANAHRVLDRIEEAHRVGSMTAMVGQGLGPFTSGLRAHAARVLPLVDVILIRDQQAGERVLKELGIDTSRVMFTADDAIEMAYEARRTAAGDLMGVGLRSATYTRTTARAAAEIRPVLQESADAHRTRLLGLPVSLSRHERDDLMLRSVLDGRGRLRCIGRRLQPPIALVKQVGLCRVVVTGAFHPAVFALSQGIPVVGLAASNMYVEKFAGLTDQFGAGCQTVRLDSHSWRETLPEAIDRAWDSANWLRPQLLRKAALLADAGRSGYDFLFSRVSPKVAQDPVSC